ncbi:UNVERIFIED_CONTAM: hypothetical protein PYX00_010717 [Menopon gallinae]|uniref:Serine/threonine-protein phosphatase n=1 Tax=Menopon gallinae TaxID=328185 RepID=A0AAW2HGD1_9NEOP
MKNMLGCGGMKKLCVCPAKTAENSSISSDYTSSSAAAAAAADESAMANRQVRDCEKKKRSLLSIFSPRNIFRGLKREIKSDNAMLKVERTIKAAILIQQWYRSYLARMEIRRRYTWTIFQSIEYQGEQNQVKVYDFFNALLTHMPMCPGKGADHEAVSKTSSLDISDKFEDESSDTSILENIDGGYKGPHIDTPITLTNFHELIDVFRKRREHRLHARYVASILREATNELKKLPNFNQASTAISKQITVCGDLHGKLDDLLVIFHKNGLPSAENPYVFNGDFVDRGKKSLEILLLLLSCLLLFPGGIFLNRGNHEDHVMNQRYGFIKEMKSKYKHNSEKLLRLIDSVYRWLPLGTIIDKKVLVVHGGISDITDLDWIKNIDRHRYVSLLRPPISENSMAGTEVVDKQEWKQE